MLDLGRVSAEFGTGVAREVIEECSGCRLIVVDGRQVDAVPGIFPPGSIVLHLAPADRKRPKRVRYGGKRLQAIQRPVLADQPAIAMRAIEWVALQVLEQYQQRDALQLGGTKGNSSMRTCNSGNIGSPFHEGRPSFGGPTARQNHEVSGSSGGRKPPTVATEARRSLVRSWFSTSSAVGVMGAQ